MSLAKGSAARILAAQPDPSALEHERTEGHCLRESPIHRQLAFAHFCAPCELANHFGIDMKTLRNNSYPVRQIANRFGWNICFDNLRAVFFRNRWAKFAHGWFFRNNLFSALKIGLIACDAFLNHRRQAALVDDALANQAL